MQAKALLGDEWIGAIDKQMPIVVCGDFNAVPGSSAYQRLLLR